MNIKTSIYPFIFFILSYSCTSNNVNTSLDESNMIKDTLQHNEILKDMDDYDSNSGSTVKLSYFRVNEQEVTNFVKNDTFILGVTYNSKKFKQLGKSYKIDLKSETKNFKILKQLPNNRFKVFVGPIADTVMFKVFISSENYLFNSYYLDNNKRIKHIIVDKIGLCRKIEIPD